MSYSTRFSGCFVLDKPLTVTQFKAIESFNSYRHDPNTSEAPDYYCDWIVNEQGTAIEAGERVSFYEYDKWLVYLIKNFIKPWGLVLNGKVTWSGEDDDDFGILVVENNRVGTREGKIVYDTQVEWLTDD